jgi:hypothetical protein
VLAQPVDDAAGVPVKQVTEVAPPHTRAEPAPLAVAPAGEGQARRRLASPPPSPPRRRSARSRRSPRTMSGACVPSPSSSASRPAPRRSRR